jgi:hypothetical protein
LRRRRRRRRRRLGVLCEGVGFGDVVRVIGLCWRIPGETIFSGNICF